MPSPARRLAVALLAALGIEGAFGPAALGSGMVAPDPTPYLEAQAGARVARVTGTATTDSRRPGEPAVPLDGVSVLLMPYSPALETELQLVREGYRQSSRSYVEAAGRIEGLRQAYETSLRSQGGGLLVRGEVSDGSGAFRFAEVPAGSWLVLAWLTQRHQLTGRRLPGQDAGNFVGNVERSGYTAVTYWLLRLDLQPGAVRTLQLSERAAWLTAVKEDQREPQKSPSGSSAGRSRRQGTTR
jgi:hypothetical protein